jgi:hypothetical protein
MSLGYTKELKERCNGHPVLEKAFHELVVNALKTRKTINQYLMSATDQSPEQRQGEVTLLEAQFDGNVKIPFCQLCRANGIEALFGAFNFDDLCNNVI